MTTFGKWNPKYMLVNRFEITKVYLAACLALLKMNQSYPELYRKYFFLVFRVLDCWKVGEVLQLLQQKLEKVANLNLALVQT